MDKRVPNASEIIKIAAMKYLFLYCFTALVCTSVSGQSPYNLIEFKGGDTAMTKSIFIYLSRNKGCYTNVSDEDRKGNKYFIVTMKIDENGRLGEECTILGIQDTTILKVIYTAIRRTDGQWINHTGSPKTVILPIYYLYEDYTKREEKKPVEHNFFFNPAQSDVICLKPFVITLERSLK